MSPVRIAMIGCGHMAGLHAPHLKRNSDVELVAACDVDKARVEQWIERHWSGRSRPVPYADPVALYRDVRPDAVIVATPHTTHFELGMQALNAGCHVLMEKPMVTSAAQARTLAERVRECGKVFIVGYNTPCTPMFVFLRDVIRRGTYGRLEMVSGYLAQNWLRYTGGTWRQDPGLSGGGEAYDSGAHLLNSLCWSVESEVREVFAWVDKKGLAVDVNSCAQVRFASGVMASLIIGGNCPVDHGALSFFFDNGKIDIDGWYAEWIRCWHGNREVVPELPPGATTPTDNLVDAILGRGAPRTSPANAIAHTELVEARYESARTGLPARPRGGVNG